LLNAKAERLTQLLSSQDTQAPQAEAAKQEVDDLTEQYEQVEAQIRDQSPRYAALTQPQSLSLEQIQKLLDADTVLLEYSLGPDHSYLWAVTQTSCQSYELAKAAEIAAVARQFYQSLRSPEPVRKSRQAKTRAERVYPAATAGEAKRLARKLSAMLLSPVAAMLGNKRLVVVADGALQYLPFAALADPTRTAKWEPLMLQHEIVSLPSASALAIQRRELEGRNPAPKTAIVIADPVFSADDLRVKRRQQTKSEEDALQAAVKIDSLNRTPAGSRTSVTDLARGRQPGSSKVRAGASRNADEHDQSLYRLALKMAIRDVRPRTAREGLSRLPGTRREGEAVVALVGAGQSKLIVDFAATRAAAESDEMSQYRYVLFATHGLIDSQNPKLSALVLSLVDEHGQPQDGYLRAYQIFNLNLPAEVVVLSACQTGLGKQVRGEGLVSLTRGFMYAGAKHVVVSLWSVNDDSTAELMARFYGGMLKEGKRPAEALRAAQIAMLTQSKRWRSPYYWAPFVLQGEWR
jgi:CHAT domain-containing protein